MGRLKKYNREDVLEKAMLAFWKNGFENTTSRILENEMGINQNSIYSEFKNKESLFLETLNCYEDKLKTGVLKSVIESKGDLEDIRLFFNRFVERVKNGSIKNGCLLTNTTVAFGGSNDRIKEYLNQFYNQLHDYFYDLIIKAQLNGQIPKNKDVNILATYLIGCTQGLKVIVKVMDENALSNYIDTVINSLK
ncbi:TetR family transcriptional regulator [Flavobacteriaceae bacterium AU392]|nr:TetR/AcrR family transcriptional regulator [Flavobacteriaceae bacterium]RKM82650.1 TetR family transcriptional regulator [Flavobacteriaceae bacterium AU392]